MKLYRSLQDLPFLPSYASKFLFVAFIGTHVPMIGLAFYLTYSGEFQQRLPIFLVVVGFTMLTTAVTLFVIHRLLDPIRLAANSIRSYFQERKPPEIPTQYRDEAGRLLHDIDQSIRQLDSLLEDKQDQMASLAHNLRQPLISIQALLEFIRDENPGQPIDTYLDKIDRICLQQLSRSDGALELLQQDKLTHSTSIKQRITLNQLIEPVLMAFEGSIQAKKLNVHRDFDPRQALEVDQAALGQVLENVVSNAVKYSDPGSAVIISAQRRPGWLTLTVGDQGRGFTPEEGEQLFERYMRAKGLDNIDGKGIGLFLSRRLIEDQGGSIRAFSPGPGRGSTFTIEVPMEEMVASS